MCPPSSVAEIVKQEETVLGKRVTRRESSNAKQPNSATKKRVKKEQEDLLKAEDPQTQQESQPLQMKVVKEDMFEDHGSE